MAVPSLPASIAVDLRLVPAVSARIEEIMAKRHIKPGDVMAELGLSRLDVSVSNAIKHGWRLKPDVITALEKWLEVNAAV